MKPVSIALFALASMFAAVVPAMAQQGAPMAPETAWQAVIHSQIQAFRDKDPEAALSFASAPFKQSFTDPRQFFLVIIASGYAPIMESRSETFGTFEQTPGGGGMVLQEVKFVGADQSLHEAFYQMVLETGGWRVAGVQLAKQAGIGV